MFRCTVGDDTFDAYGLRNAGEFIINAKIGFDDAVGTVYNAFVVLASRPGMADLRVYDLAFSIVEAQPDGTHISAWSDGLRSRAVIVDREDRMRVMNAICAAVEHLIDTVEPLGIVMQTYTPDLPRKALVKYERLEAVVIGKGYEGGTTECYHGRWLFEFERVVVPVGNPSPDQPLPTDDPKGDMI